MNTDVTGNAAWTQPPFLMEWHAANPLPLRAVRPFQCDAAFPLGSAPPPWVETGPTGQPFDFGRAILELTADVCRHVPEFTHIKANQILISFLQARHARGHGLQARVTPLRFPGGHLVKTARGRLFQVQRLVVEGHEILYLMTFCLPRFLNQSFDEKFVTLFHELFHIGPKFDGDLRRHRGRCSVHTSSKAAYDQAMAEWARQYLARGANPRLHSFLRLNFAQLLHRHGRVLAVKVPRPRILPVPLELSQACRAT